MLQRMDSGPWLTLFSRIPRFGSRHIEVFGMTEPYLAERTPRSRLRQAPSTFQVRGLRLAVVIQLVIHLPCSDLDCVDSYSNHDVLET